MKCCLVISKIVRLLYFLFHTKMNKDDSIRKNKLLCNEQMVKVGFV